MAPGQGPPEAVACDGGVRGRRRRVGSPRIVALDAVTRRGTLRPTGEGVNRQFTGRRDHAGGPVLSGALRTLAARGRR